MVSETGRIDARVSKRIAFKHVADWVIRRRKESFFPHATSVRTNIRTRGPFLEGPELFSQTESRSKISNLMTTELV